ncbi:hypothetical protein GQ54DRAFT_76592 [Martensiomyces pterosporus]|nr:hypothetical protein GQ54DRAFT_76592 [Martensiomyces pterosporus]
MERQRRKRESKSSRKGVPQNLQADVIFVLHAAHLHPLLSPAWPGAQRQNGCRQARTPPLIVPAWSEPRKKHHWRRADGWRSSCAWASTPNQCQRSINLHFPLSGSAAGVLAQKGANKVEVSQPLALAADKASQAPRGPLPACAPQSYRRQGLPHPPARTCA